MTIKLGSTAQYIRKMHGLKQKDAAVCLGISVVHLCNIEKDKSKPSDELLERYREHWGIDLYVLAWCLHGDCSKLPESVREPMEAIASAWQQELEVVAEQAGREVRNASNMSSKTSGQIAERN